MKKLVIFMLAFTLTKVSLASVSFTIAPTRPFDAGLNSIVLNTQTETKVDFTLQMTRGVNSNGTYESVYAVIYFIYDVAGKQMQIAKREINSESFNNSTINSSLVLTYPKYEPNAKIMVKVDYGNDKGKQISSTNTVPYIPPTITLTEGTLIQQNDKVYIVMDGLLRHILSPVTMNKIFINNPPIIRPTQPYSNKIGSEIVATARLVSTPFDGKVYFEETIWSLSLKNGYKEIKRLRHIISPEVANMYSFKLSNLPTIPNTQGYEIGEKMILKSVVEGSLVRSNDGKLYTVIGGVARHIEKYETYTSIFNVNASIINTGYMDAIPFPVGASLRLGSRLVNDVTTGRVYLQDGNVLMYVSNMDVVNKYSFDLSKVQNINGTAGYVLGNTLL
ncbi:hypothetical protein DHW03_14750 [Pedobacter yonginense]|uniref:Uncharacterized protein n=1 Tax=Pedobacter yonginense TaxID=651869 RepID=A0A317EPM9_9SPHI|nr:hypothetical protein [Pedobacter yonginense]PWS27246.1 hypothetical protein DHW03_14750 [Pedobacter yonginense]